MLYAITDLIRIFFLNNSDLYEDIFDIIDTCTFSTKQISQTMWGIFELIYKTFKDTGIDYIEGIIKNFAIINFSS